MFWVFLTVFGITNNLNPVSSSKQCSVFVQTTDKVAIEGMKISVVTVVG